MVGDGVGLGIACLVLTAWVHIKTYAEFWARAKDMRFMCA